MIYGTRFRIVAALFVVALAALVQPQAKAADATVNCPNGGGGSYATINEALNAIGPVGPNTVTVTGTCKEDVYIYNSSLIKIKASAPGVAKVDGAVDVEQSWGITLVNMDIRGDPQISAGGVVPYSHSQVTIQGCNIHDGGNGVYVDGSEVVIRNSTIQNNMWDALDVVNYSSADVGGSTLQANGSGVFIDNHASVLFRGRNSILNNGSYGFFVRDLSRLYFTSGDPANFSTIQGHNIDGITLNKQSVLEMDGGAHLIQGNGSSCSPPEQDCGGIFAIRNSTIRINGANISGNHGSGISVYQGIDVALSSSTISNNSGDGVHLAQISIGDFNFMSLPGYNDNIITGNGGASVFCDKTSLAVGDLSRIHKKKCENIEGSDGNDHHGDHDGH